MLSDTHGSLSSKVTRILGKTDLIVHAGDFDTGEVYHSLEKIAPLKGVRGNMDHGEWTMALPPYNLVEIGETLFLVIHNLNLLDMDPASMGVSAVVFGHTHLLHQHSENGVMYLNPGSTRYPRQKTGETMMILRVAEGRIEPDIIHLS